MSGQKGPLQGSESAHPQCAHSAVQRNCEVEGPITLQCVSGSAVLGLEGKELELRPGQWTYLEGGVRHWVRGVEDSVLLLTIIFKA